MLFELAEVHCLTEHRPTRVALCTDPYWDLNKFGVNEVAVQVTTQICNDIGRLPAKNRWNKNKGTK